MAIIFAMCLLTVNEYHHEPSAYSYTEFETVDGEMLKCDVKIFKSKYEVEYYIHIHGYSRSAPKIYIDGVEIKQNRSIKIVRYERLYLPMLTQRKKIKIEYDRDLYSVEIPWHTIPKNE